MREEERDAGVEREGRSQPVMATETDIDRSSAQGRDSSIGLGGTKDAGARMPKFHR